MFLFAKKKNQERDHEHVQKLPKNYLKTPRFWACTCCDWFGVKTGVSVLSWAFGEAGVSFVAYVPICKINKEGGHEHLQKLPKIIHQRFGVKASYIIEQVHVSSQNTCLYWCHLQLPDFSVVSNVFKKKQDSEQSTTELALEKVRLFVPSLFYNYLFVKEENTIHVEARHSPLGWW